MTINVTFHPFDVDLGIRTDLPTLDYATYTDDGLIWDNDAYGEYGPLVCAIAERAMRLEGCQNGDPTPQTVSAAVFNVSDEVGDLIIAGVDDICTARGYWDIPSGCPKAPNVQPALSEHFTGDAVCRARTGTNHTMPTTPDQPMSIDAIIRYLDADPGNTLILCGLTDLFDKVTFDPQIYVIRSADPKQYAWGTMPAEDPNDAHLAPSVDEALRDATEDYWR